MDLSSLTHSITSFSTDWIALILLAGLFTFDALRGGSSRVAAISLALPLGALIFALLPHTAFVSTIVTSGSPYILAGIYVALVVALFLLLYRLTDTVNDSHGPLQALMSGVAAMIILVVVWQMVPALNALWNVSPYLQGIFGEAYRAFWLLGAYAALAFARS